jgi:hypothetical protein
MVSGNASFANGSTVLLQVDLDASPLTLYFFVDGTQRPNRVTSSCPCFPLNITPPVPFHRHLPLFLFLVSPLHIFLLLAPVLPLFVVAPSTLHLVIAPNQVMKNSWDRERRSWSGGGESLGRRGRWGS